MLLIQTHVESRRERNRIQRFFATTLISDMKSLVPLWKGSGVSEALKGVIKVFPLALLPAGPPGGPRPSPPGDPGTSWPFPSLPPDAAPAPPNAAPAGASGSRPSRGAELRTRGTRSRCRSWICLPRVASDGFSGSFPNLPEGSSELLEMGFFPGVRVSRFPRRTLWVEVRLGVSRQQEQRLPAGGLLTATPGRLAKPCEAPVASLTLVHVSEGQRP